MSSARKSRTRSATGEATTTRKPPFVGALLRMAYQAARRRQFRAHIERGFNDLTQAHLNVLAYPPPDGIRPTDLAERTYMTKQAMNYLLIQLESLGYIERRAEKARGRRLVFLTRRGWQVFETQWASMQQLEAEWAAIVGQSRFDEFTRTLRQLVAIESPPSDQSRARSAGLVPPGIPTSAARNARTKRA